MGLASDFPPVPPVYRGRFAPSPTGPLHFGSLVAATGSYLDARHANGEWLVRIEDVDTPRSVPGSADQIIEELRALGFQWNESIVRQSERTALYQSALEQLLASGNAYPCSCSRTEIQAAALGVADGGELRYPGWCRGGVQAPDRAVAIRFRAPLGTTTFDDVLQGEIVTAVSHDVGDFVVRRRDGLFAYQLAVVLDDHAQGITHVVRGADLLSSTPRQILLQQALGLPSPTYAHLPVAIDVSGIKLSKSTGAARIDLRQPGQELWRVLRFLRQEPPIDLRRASLAELWDWAIRHWNSGSLRHSRAQALGSD